MSQPNDRLPHNCTWTSFLCPSKLSTAIHPLGEPAGDCLSLLHWRTGRAGKADKNKGGSHAGSQRQRQPATKQNHAAYVAALAASTGTYAAGATGCWQAAWGEMLLETQVYKPPCRQRQHKASTELRMCVVIQKAELKSHRCRSALLYRRLHSTAYTEQPQEQYSTTEANNHVTVASNLWFLSTALAWRYAHL